MHDELRTESISVRRTARFLMVGGEPGAVAEVWYVLHGYAELASEVAPRVACLASRARRVVVPEGLSRFYRRGTSGEIGASWMTREARDDEIADYVGYLDALHARVAAEVGGAPRVCVLGFSQGTATACRWAALGAVDPARVIVWGGALPPDLPVEGRAERFRGLEHVVGERDPYISEERIEAERARVEAHGLPWRLTMYAGGHHLDEDVLRALASSS